MTELSTRICFSMYLSYLNKFLGNKVANELPSSFREEEKVVLILKELGYLLILFQIVSLDGMLKSKTQVSDILHDFLSIFYDCFLLVKGLVIGSISLHFVVAEP